VSEKAGEMPLGRPLPEDVARAVVFLLEANATTGCIIPVDGGQSLL
jgi:NAD(P)-dependent dehydrogenase (short-subunit alcohol dehydrogenase family)